MKNDKKENKALSQTSVSGSILISNVPNSFAYCVKKYHKEFNVKLKSIKDYRNNWKTVHVVGNIDDLILLNAKCEKEAYRNLQNLYQ